MEFRTFTGLFKKREIENMEDISFLYINRKKIVTYVPLEFVDKLTFEMSFAGAGKIGNYHMCSFRMKGLGTYLPGKKTNPFTGKKGKLSFEEEVRLEVECGEESLDKVIDALLLNHPYEEVAYEIYDFQKRTDIPSSCIITFKEPLFVNDIISRINKKIKTEYIGKKKKINRLFFTSLNYNRKISYNAKEKNCNIILYSENNNIKFKYI